MDISAFSCPSGGFPSFIDLHVAVEAEWKRKWQPTPVFLPGESQGWGAWWAAVYGVAQTRIRLKRLSSSSSSLVWAEHLQQRASIDEKALIKEQPPKLNLGNSQPGDLNSKMHLQVTSFERFLVL